MNMIVLNVVNCKFSWTFCTFRELWLSFFIFCNSCRDLPYCPCIIKCSLVILISKYYWHVQSPPKTVYCYKVVQRLSRNNEIYYQEVLEQESAWNPELALELQKQKKNIPANLIFPSADNFFDWHVVNPSVLQYQAFLLENDDCLDLLLHSNWIYSF